MTSAVDRKSLYDRDFLLWTQETARLLKVKDFESLELDNLIEEIEALGRSEKRELKNRLSILLEHLLKRLYVKMPREYKGWERTIREQRIQIELLLDDSPSLKTQWDRSCNLAWSLALKKLKGDYPNVKFPNVYPFPIDSDTLVNQNFWES